MRILLCHNSYKFRGGEDQVFEDELWLLESHGHDVATFQKSNSSVDEHSSMSLAANTVWSRQTYRELDRLIRDFRPDVVHFHNTFPIISPSAYYAAKRNGVPVVQTLHNYRLICPGSTLLRRGEICDACVGKLFAWQAVRSRCYRNSCSASFMSAATLATHHLWGTWKKSVDTYIALTEFSKGRFAAGGLPKERIRLKPNFVRPDPGAGTKPGDHMVFVGRLAPEKGVEVLAETWRQSSDLPTLKIIGEGPLESAISGCDKLERLGQVAHNTVLREIASARALVFPSIWHETFGRSIVEAFATGTPVIATNLAPMNQLVTDDQTGLLFERGDPASLAGCVRRIQRDEQLYQRLRTGARTEFETKYTATQNLETLLSIYRDTCNERRTQD